MVMTTFIDYYIIRSPCTLPFIITSSPIISTNSIPKVSWWFNHRFICINVTIYGIIVVMQQMTTNDGKCRETNSSIVTIFLEYFENKKNKKSISLLYFT